MKCVYIFSSLTHLVGRGKRGLIYTRLLRPLRSSVLSTRGWRGSVGPSGWRRMSSVGGYGARQRLTWCTVHHSEQREREIKKMANNSLEFPAQVPSLKIVT